jgi:endonuclease/exonuclease/phosphatase (EEP) superfamily protein YafD
MLSRGRWSALLAAVLVLVSLPWAFGYLLPQRGTVTLGLAALAGYSPIPVVVLLIVALAARLWPASVVAVVLLVAQVATLGPAYVGDGDPRPGRRVVTVMTSNLLFGGADTAQVVRLVRERQVDVLALEELSPGAVAGLEQAGLREELPYAINRPAVGANGTGLWSRLPMAEVPVLPLRFYSCAGDIQLDGRVLRVRAVHPVPPIPPRAWRRDFAVLRAQSQQDAVPTLLLGDFNASVHHRELRRLLAGRWRDAAEAEGAGLVRTWSPRARLPAVLDPDHVLVDRGMTVRSWSSVPIRRSDHRAVIVEVAVG